MRIFERFRNGWHRTLRLRRALQLVWESGPGWAIINAVLLVAQGIFPLLSLYMMKLTLDAITAALLAPDKSAELRHVVLVIGLAGIVTLAGNLTRTIGRLVTQAQGRVVADHMHEIIHAKSIEVDLEYYENAQYYDALHLAQQEAAFRPLYIVNGLVQAGQSAVSLLAIAGLLFAFHWSVSVILLIAVAPGIFVRLKYSDKLYQLQRRQITAERRSWYFHQILTGSEHAKEVRIFDLGPTLMNRFCDLRQGLRQEKLQIDIRRSALEFVTQIGATVAVFGSYALIAYETILGAITLGDLVMYYQAFQRGQGFLQDMLSNLASLYENSLFLNHLYEFLDLKRKVIEPEHPRPVPDPMQKGIVFDRIHFHYPGTTREVLQDVCLTIRPGQVVALVGENGSGKTTLVKLLCRLYDPTMGAIMIDGFDVRQFETVALRREISIIFQDYARYNLTAGENIWFGNVQRSLDQDEIAAAALRAGAHDTIMSLGEGYDTVLGKMFDKGEELSVGQWQKVALARAFFRDAQIIVLDEPTSAMDPKAEYEVFKKFRDLLAGRTAFLISHRLSTVKMADTIYVLHGGRIVESGTHDELMHRDGKYAHLFETQAQYYHT